MADDSPRLVLPPVGRVRICLGDGGSSGTEYRYPDYVDSVHHGASGSRYDLARTHRIAVIIVACLIIGISLTICLTMGR